VNKSDQKQAVIEELVSLAKAPAITEDLDSEIAKFLFWVEMGTPARTYTKCSNVPGALHWYLRRERQVLEKYSKFLSCWNAD